MQKKLIYILLLISLFSLTFGCQTESYDFGREDGSIEVLEDGRLRVPILLHIPEREVVETKTTPNETETTINNAYVLVFEVDDLDSNNQKVYSLLQCVEATQNPSDKTKIYADLKTYPKSCLIHILANLSPDNEAEVKAATKLDNIRHLVENKDNSLDLNPALLPLSSAGVQLSAISTTTVTNLTILLNFAYARIDVNAEDIKGQFTLHEAYVFKAARIGYVIEHAGINIDPDGTPSKTCSANENNINGIYVFENNGAKPENTQGSNPTDLIIKGTKTGFGEGYYKIRIAYLKENIKTYDIRRGVRYAVKITSVKGPGYTSAEEAELHEPSNVEYDITVNDGSSKDVIVSNGKYYLGVSNSEFIVCADNAYGVTATTLSHNAPGSVSTATIQVQGEEITLSANQQGLTVSTDGKSATINLKTPKVPIKVNLTSTTQSGTLTIRIGDLVKTISIKKMAMVENDGGTKSLSDLGLANSSVVTMSSLSPRITVGQDKSLVIAKAVDSKYDAYSYAEAFSTGQQGTIRIAVKQTILNVVYYEQYSDESYGFYFRDNTSTLSEDKTIKDTGYGILGTRSDITNIKLNYQTAGQAFQPVMRTISVQPDCPLNFYPMSHKDITPVEHTAALAVLVNTDTQSSNYIYPNFAKVISTSSSISTGTQGYPAFSIRTPKQFRNINTMDANSTSRFFKQERDLNFADTNIGGAASFPSSIITNSFTGNYDGAGKRISNLTLNVTSTASPNIAIFASLGTSANKTGSVKNLVLNNLSVTGKVNRVACLAARNYGVIEGIHATKCKVVSSFTFYDNSMPGVGIIVGENFNTIKNCLVEFHDDGFTISSTTVRVGCIVGCNQENSYGVSDCCVVATINPFGDTIQKYTGGIVGFNESPAVRCIYLAGGPLFNSSRWPISGGNDGYYSNTTTDCYFLKGKDYNSETSEGGGIGYTTEKNWVKPPYKPGYWVNGFKEKSLNDLGLKSSGYWEKETENISYPYPKLKSFQVPPKEYYPVAN